MWQKERSKKTITNFFSMCISFLYLRLKKTCKKFGTVRFIFAFEKKTCKKFETVRFIFSYTLINFSWMMKFESACPWIWLNVHIWISVFWRKQLQWRTLRSPISFDSSRRTATNWCEWIIYFFLFISRSVIQPIIIIKKKYLRTILFYSIIIWKK